jgi:hypothetical protein
MIEGIKMQAKDMKGQRKTGRIHRRGGILTLVVTSLALAALTWCEASEMEVIWTFE